MKSKKKASSFTNDPNYFGKHFISRLLIFSVLLAIVWVVKKPFEQLSYWWLLGLLPLFLARLRYIAVGSAIVMGAVMIHFGHELSAQWIVAALLASYGGCLSAVWIHNAAHGNFKPLWLNPIVGGITALQQLSAGFPIWRLMHNLHHANPDHPEFDPHPPRGMSFLQFIDSTRVMVGCCLTRYYCRRWGDTPEVRARWRRQISLHVPVRAVKAIFLFVVLGPKIFALVFVPSYLANVLFFACFNYFTHREQIDGAVEICNLDDHLVLKLANAVLCGALFHRNHHQNPKLFNPKYLQVSATHTGQERACGTEATRVDSFS